MGIGFYTLDIYTDIKFTLDMYSQSERNFAESFFSCFEKFKGEFEQTIQTCKLSFDKKKACMNHLALVKKSANGCFQAEDRFEHPNEWKIAGVVSVYVPFTFVFLYLLHSWSGQCSSSKRSAVAQVPYLQNFLFPSSQKPLSSGMTGRCTRTTPTQVKLLYTT